MKNIIIILMLLIFLSCRERNTSYEVLDKKNNLSKNSNNILFNSRNKGSLLNAGSAITIIKRNEVNDSLISSCSCDDKEKNLVIQIRTIFTSKSNKEKKSLLIPPVVFDDKSDVEFRFFNINIKDSIITKKNLYKLSSKKIFNAKNKKNENIKSIKIIINKTDKINNGIYGEYELILEDDFGYTDNDLKINGIFKCKKRKVLLYTDLELLKNKL